MSRSTAAVSTAAIPYRGVPSDVATHDPADIIYSGRTGTPFVETIRQLEDTVQDMRVAIARYLDIWTKVKDAAQQNDDTLVYNRAKNELDGLYALLSRITHAVS